MSEIIFIKNYQLNETDLLEICKIKNENWPYSLDSQIDWIKANVKMNDVHVLLKVNNTVESYLNLIEIELQVDNNNVMAYGIGNVCTKTKGCGYGANILIAVAEQLKLENKIGLLFCKRELIEFYKKYEWSLLNKSSLILAENDESIEVMAFGIPANIFIMKYLGAKF